MVELKNNGRFLRRIYFPALLPNIIAVLGGTVNVFFDGILVGQRLGETGLQAVNQSLPVYLTLCTVGSLFASGASILSSMEFGKSRKEEASRIFNATLLITAAVAVVLCALGYLASSAITGVVSTAQTYEYVLTYIRITLAGGIFKIILYMSYFYLRLEGKNRRAMSAMLTMTVLNVVLDYVFLYGFDMGIAGAAWASVAATAVACVMSFAFLFTGNTNFKPRFALLEKGELVSILKYGSPMALNNVLSSARIVAVNLILKSMGMSSLLTAFAVVNNINELSICVQNGIPQTAIPMMGVLRGEKDSFAIKRMLKLQMFTGAVLSAALGLIFSVFSSPIAGLFGSESDCTFAIVCFSVSLVFATFNGIMSYYYNLTGRIGMANIINVCRGFITVAVFCLAFSPLGEWVWLFYPVSEIVSAAIFILASLVASRMDGSAFFYLIRDDRDSGETDISFTVECNKEKICEASEKIRVFCDENEFSPKKAMAISLAIEEILTIISEKSLEWRGVLDVRLTKNGDDGMLRIMSSGKRYDPFAEQDDTLDYIGVQMISKLAKEKKYLSVLGINTIIIFL